MSELQSERSLILPKKDISAKNKNEDHKAYYERFEERYQNLQKQIIINEKGQEILIPNFVEMSAMYQLIPTRLNKSMGTTYEENRMVFETDLLQQENKYHELKDNYEDTLVYHNEQYEFIGDHQLPNIKNLQFPDIQTIPTLVSGRDWKEVVKINLEDKLIPIELISQYPNLTQISDTNQKYDLTRWPFVLGLNTQDSAFCHYQLSLEKIRPLDVYFTNDFFSAFKEDPSKTELTKRARILAKVYCKNILHKEQDKISSQLQEMRRIQKDKEDHEFAFQNKIQDTSHMQINEIPPPPPLPVNPELSLQNNFIVYNPALIGRIHDLYKQIYEWLEERTYDNYQKEKFKEALDYKRKREEVERDMVVITNPEQLLRILLLFKMTHKI